MTTLLHPGHVVRTSETGRLGRILIVSGAGLLAFSGVCLWRTSGPYLEIQSASLVLFAAGAVLALAGETVRMLSRERERESQPPQDWADVLKARKAASHIESVLRDPECAFCGRKETGPGSGRKATKTREGGSSAFGRCLNCGRTSCPRCSFLKGLEMGLKTLRCPGCGGPIY